MAGALELKYALQGDLRTIMAANQKRVAVAITGGIKAAALQVKTDFRQQVLREFKRTPPYAKRFGQNIDKATNATGFPDKRGKVSINAALVARAVPAFMEIFTTGGTISGGAHGLVIALPIAKRKTLERSFHESRKGGGSYYRKYSDIAGAERLFGKLRRIPVKGHPGWYLLAADKKRAALQGLRAKRGLDFVPLFLIRPEVTEPIKFDFQGPVKRAEQNLPALVDNFFEQSVG